MISDPSSPISIRGVFDGESFRVAAGQLRCRIGKDVQLYPQALETFCFKTLQRRDEELVYFAGVIAFADRAVHRSAVRGWKRTLHVIMPVSEPKAWSRVELKKTLIEALNYLSGDVWSFDFIKRRGRLPQLTQPELDLGQGEFVVMPFSNGLDSFAQSRLLRTQRPAVSPIRITAWNGGLAGGRDWVTEADGSRFRRVPVPIKIATKSNADATYRTRAFLFSVLAGLASHLSGAGSIIIPEAGQGALGPALLPLGAESPHRGSHPGFSRRMEEFFLAFWGQRLVIEHPQLWRTKGEVLIALKQAGMNQGWQETRSCSLDRRWLQTKRRVLLHCGICSGCLLRRLAAVSAGLPEPSDHYRWTDLNASSLAGSLCKDATRATSLNDQDIAVHAVMALEDLARMADSPDTHPRFETTLFDMFGNDSSKITAGAIELRRLLSAHKAEWRAFTAQLDPHSWVTQQIAMQ